MPEFYPTIMRVRISILIFILSISCRTPDSDFERTELLVGNQKFEILTANEIIDNFVSSGSLYLKTVFPKIEEEFAPNAEFPFLLETLKSEIKPDENYKEESELLKNYDFRQVVEKTFQRVVKELPGPDTKILFIPANPAYREVYASYGIGVNAGTVGTGKIIVSINPTIDDWEQLLPYALAHEYHHSVWTSRNFESAEFTPLEYLILEGRADSFAHELFPETKHPFIKALSDKELKRVWNIIKPEIHIRNSGLNDQLMAGTNKIPTGSVYSIGFALIESVKKNHQQIGDKELIDMSPEQILLLSKFDQ